VKSFDLAEDLDHLDVNPLMIGQERGRMPVKVCGAVKQFS